VTLVRPAHIFGEERKKNLWKTFAFHVKMGPFFFVMEGEKIIFVNDASQTFWSSFNSTTRNLYCLNFKEN